MYTIDPMINGMNTSSQDMVLKPFDRMKNRNAETTNPTINHATRGGSHMNEKHNSCLLLSPVSTYVSLSLTDEPCNARRICNAARLKGM